MESNCVTQKVSPCIRTAPQGTEQRKQDSKDSGRLVDHTCACGQLDSLHQGSPKRKRRLRSAYAR